MQALSDGRVRRSRAEWQQIVNRYEKSSLSEAEFCRHEEVLRGTFVNWRRRLRRPAKAPGAFVEVVRSPVLPEVQPSVGGEFEISLPGGVTLRWKA